MKHEDERNKLYKQIEAAKVEISRMQQQIVELTRAHSEDASKQVMMAQL